MYNLLRLRRILPGDPEPPPPRASFSRAVATWMKASPPPAMASSSPLWKLLAARAWPELGLLLDLHGQCVQRVTAHAKGVVVLRREYPVTVRRSALLP